MPSWPGSGRGFWQYWQLRLVVRRVLGRLLVGRDVALVVAEHDLVVRVADEVVRHDRDLAAATGRVDDELRDRVARRVAAQALDDLEALADRRPEVAGALDQVALVEVVRAGTRISTSRWTSSRWMCTQSLTPGEQHRLVAQRDAGAAQLVAGAGELGRDLVGVVDVDVHPQRVVLGEHLAQLVVDPLRQEHRHARADPDDLDVRDLAQAADRRLEQLRGERQAVAAGDQHVADLGRPADVVELRLVLAAVEVLGRVADDPAPRAVAAVAGALRRDQHQDAVRVAVDEPGDGRVAVLREAVLHHPGEARAARARAG